MSGGRLEKKALSASSPPALAPMAMIRTSSLELLDDGCVFSFNYCSIKFELLMRLLCWG